MIGEKYGYLTVVEEAGRDKYHRRMLKCVCDCGATKIVDMSALKSGATKSCGCKKYEWRDNLAADNIKPALTLSYIHRRIDALRKNISHLEGKKPDEMNKGEWLAFYCINSRICELQELIGEG